MLYLTPRQTFVLFVLLILLGLAIGFVLVVSGLFLMALESAMSLSIVGVLGVRPLPSIVTVESIPLSRYADRAMKSDKRIGRRQATIKAKTHIRKTKVHIAPVVARKVSYKMVLLSNGKRLKVTTSDIESGRSRYRNDSYRIMKSYQRFCYDYDRMITLKTCVIREVTAEELESQIAAITKRLNAIYTRHNYTPGTGQTLDTLLGDIDSQEVKHLRAIRASTEHSLSRLGREIKPVYTDYRLFNLPPRIPCVNSTFFYNRDSCVVPTRTIGLHKAGKKRSSTKVTVKNVAPTKHGETSSHIVTLPDYTKSQLTLMRESLMSQLAAWWNEIKHKRGNAKNKESLVTLKRDYRVIYNDCKACPTYNLQLWAKQAELLYTEFMTVYSESTKTRKREYVPRSTNKTGRKAGKISNAPTVNIKIHNKDESIVYASQFKLAEKRDKRNRAVGGHVIPRTLYNYVARVTTGKKVTRQFPVPDAGDCLEYVVNGYMVELSLS